MLCYSSLYSIPSYTPAHKHETHQRCEYSSCYTLFHCFCLFYLFLLFIFSFRLKKTRQRKVTKVLKGNDIGRMPLFPAPTRGEGSLPHPRAGRNTSLGSSTSAALTEQSLGVQGHVRAATPAICTGNVPLWTGTTLRLSLLLSTGVWSKGATLPVLHWSA